MATLADRELTVKFSGLTSTAVTAITFLVIGFTLEEYLKRLRRYPAEDKRRAAGDPDVRPDRGMEGWAMGYLYRARTYVPVNPTKDYSNWPLVWIWRGLMTPEKFYEESCGPDATVYVRFLRGAFYWTLSLTLTVFPVLTSLNWVYSPSTVSRYSIDRASTSSLALSPTNSYLLYVHVICLWLLSLGWIFVLFWIGYGAIRVRRNVLRSLLVSPPRLPEYIDPSGTADIGWRFRSVMMRNIPEAMRSPIAIREYFEFHLRNRIPTDPGTNGVGLSPKPFPLTRVKSSEREREMTRVIQEGRRERRYGNRSRIGVEQEVEGEEEEELIEEIVLVRKESELNELWIKYGDTQQLLETAHVVLARAAVAWAEGEVKRREKDSVLRRTTSKIVSDHDGAVDGEKEKPEDDHDRPSPTAHLTPLHRLSIFLHLRPPPPPPIPSENDEYLLDQLLPFLPNAPPRKLGKDGKLPPSLWEVLHDLDPVLLDRFQPLYKLRHFRNQKVPSIDYFLTRLNLLSALIEDKRSNPESFEPASSAFITFTRASDARRARHELSTRPGAKLGQRVFECKVRWAPEARDLDWTKICRVIPLSFLVGLLSITSISKYIPALATYLNSHTTVQSLFSNLLPTSIVALLGMLVPTLIGMLTRNGQIFITVSKVHSAVQARYWKWLMVNIILVFCVGLTAFTAFITVFENAFIDPTSVLTVVASAFPKGATFFVSWALLVVGVHHGIEHSLFGIPFINHASIRNMKAPRKREFEALPRSFSYFYWLPNHLLVIAVTCIFTILNPMILPFTLVYQGFCLSVFKNQFAHVYWRRWYEGQGRLVFRRLFRYSLDTFMVAQVVGLALFEVLKFFKLGGAIIPLIPITAFVKLIGTRWFDQMMDEIDEVEAELMCGHSEAIDPSALSLSVPLTQIDEDLSNLTWHQRFSTIGSFATRTLPALTFRPKEGLPSVPSTRDPDGGIRSPNRPRALSHLSHTRAQTSLDDDQPMLGRHNASGDSGSDTTREGDSNERQVLASQTAAVDNPNHELIMTHPPIIRDDRPLSHIHYANPAAVEPLARSLWLPRDPLVPLDLGDTINYYGHALVSSEGGRGIIGSWDEHLSDAQAIETVTGERPLSQDAEMGHPSPGINSITSVGARPARQLDGSERIRVASDIATRVEAEGGAKAIGRRRGSSTGSGSLIPPGMRRRGTANSASSAGIGSFVLGTPPAAQHSPLHLRPEESPSIHRNYLTPPIADPPIPSFTAEPESLAMDSDFPFPPLPYSADPADRERRQVSRDENGRVQITPLRVTSRQYRSPSLGLPNQARSPRSPSSMGLTRRDRSGSVVPSIQGVVEEDEGVFSISQADALRGEVLEEERREHAKRVKQEASEKSKERVDRKSGFLTNLMRRHSETGET
ncbi:calcium permeable stress-gated cation channel, partial [Phenoliferia sp. Uapishka_3]